MPQDLFDDKGILGIHYFSFNKTKIHIQYFLEIQETD